MVAAELMPQLLLGTHKAPFSWAQVPEAIRPHLEGIAFPDSESALLSALSCAWAADQLQLPDIAVQPMQAAPAELRPLCTEDQADLWLRIRAAEYKTPALESLWLRQCAQRDAVIAPTMIASVLQLRASRKCPFLLFMAIEKVLSERARWILHLVPTLNRSKPPSAPPEPAYPLNANDFKAAVKAGNVHLLASGLGVLPETEREALMLTLENTANLSQHLPWHTDALQFEWSLPFSEWVLRHLYQSWGGYYFHHIQQILPLHVWIHPEANVEAVPQLNDPVAQRDRWLQIVAPEIMQVQALKKQLV
jgi:hypothetical protein